MLQTILVFGLHPSTKTRLILGRLQPKKFAEKRWAQNVSDIAVVMSWSLYNLYKSSSIQHQEMSILEW
jgi:hypothetical protein